MELSSHCSGQSSMRLTVWLFTFIVLFSNKMGELRYPASTKPIRRHPAPFMCLSTPVLRTEGSHFQLSLLHPLYYGRGSHERSSLTSDRRTGSCEPNYPPAWSSKCKRDAAEARKKMNFWTRPTDKQSPFEIQQRRGWASTLLESFAS